MKTVDIKAEGRKITIIDYLKGYSILTIVIMHLFLLIKDVPSFIMKPLMIGGSGVHVFFFCSGVGLYYSYLHHETGFCEFFKRRFFKIYFPYIVIVFLTFLVPWSYSGSDRVLALLSHVFLFKMFIPAYDETFGAQFWFISTIFQFYFVFIPMCRLKKRITDSKVFVSAFFLVSLAWWIFCYVFRVYDIRVFKSFFLQYIWEFALGFVVAEKIFNGKEYKLPIGTLFFTAFIGLLLQASMSVLGDSISVFNDIPAFLGYISLALLLSCVKPVRWIVQKVSYYSYELFLVHILVYTVIMHFVKAYPFLIRFCTAVICFCLSFVVAYYYKKICSFVGKKWESKAICNLR